MKRIKSFEHKYLLYLIATPIGNLSEFSKRALDTINLMDVIACEDTRNTGLLLSKFGVKKDLMSLREHNEVQSSEAVINLIKQNKKVAYVSDAGYPGISDPGHILVKKCLENDIAISTISGPSAFLNALVSSGLNTDHFYFHGFLSPKETEARKELLSLINKQETIIFYEAPHRIMNTLKIIFDVFGDRAITLARELTKINEEYIRGNISELLALEPNSLKGEMVLIVEGNKQINKVSDEEIEERIKYLLTKNLTKKDISEIISYEFNINKNDIKKMLMK